MEKSWLCQQTNKKERRGKEKNEKKERRKEKRKKMFPTNGKKNCERF